MLGGHFNLMRALILLILIYIKSKQVAALLNYGEPQILELFKNTLPSKLYYMVYHIYNLREAVETAKCMLTKEQIDKQKSGQPSVNPFMKVNQQNPSSKGVSFSTMEIIQKQDHSIDKLTSLMNELSSKLDTKENTAQYKPRTHQGRNGGCGQRQNRYSSRGRSYSREQGPYNNGRRNYQTSINYGNRSYKSRNGGYQTNNRYNDRSNYRRESFNQDYGQRNRNRSVSKECNRSRPRYRITSRDNSVNRYRNSQSRSRDRGQRSRTMSRDRGDRSRSRSSSCVRTNRDRSRYYRCYEYDHFTRECPNIMLDEEKDGVFQLLAQEEQMEALNYSEMCDLNLQMAKMMLPHFCHSP